MPCGFVYKLAKSVTILFKQFSFIISTVTLITFLIFRFKKNEKVIYTAFTKIIFVIIYANHNINSPTIDLIFPIMNIIANTKTIIINKIDIEGYDGDISPEINIEKQNITQKWKILDQCNHCCKVFSFK